MNQDIGRAIVFSIPAVSAAVSLIMISLDITRSSNTVNRKIHYSIITVYCLIMLYWSGLVMYSIARDAFIAYLPVCFSSFSFIPIFLYMITYIITGVGDRKHFPTYHFILPACLTVTIHVIAFTVPFQQRWNAIYDNGVSLTSAIIDSTYIICILLSILYSGLSLLRIKSYKRQVTNYSADIYRMSLDWLSFIIIFRVLLQTLPIAGLILGIELFNKLGVIWTFTTLPAVFTQIVLCLNILSENYVIIEPITAKEKEMTTSGNYTQLERQRVEKYLENEKPYLNPEFKITDMAKDLFFKQDLYICFHQPGIWYEFQSFYQQLPTKGSRKTTVRGYTKKAKNILDGNCHSCWIQ